MLQAMRGQSTELGAAADAAQARLDAAASHHHAGGGGGRHSMESGGLSMGGGRGSEEPAGAPSASAAGARGGGGGGGGAGSSAQVQQALAMAQAAQGSRARKAEELSVAMGRGSAGAAEELDKSHKFWSTQPVPRMASREAAQHGPLEPLKGVEDVKKAPLPLPKGFEWCEIDIRDPAQLREMYTVR